MLKNLKEWKTTIVGVITILLFGLVSFNMISGEQSAELKIAIENILEVIPGGNITAILTVVVTNLAAVLALFVKDPKKE